MMAPHSRSASRKKVNTDQRDKQQSNANPLQLTNTGLPSGKNQSSKYKVNLFENNGEKSQNSYLIDEQK
jgi:hypothetical protein